VPRFAGKPSTTALAAEPTSSGDVDIWEIHDELLKEVGGQAA
jgi:hypothetical protein